MKCSKKVLSVAHDLVNTVSVIEMELKLLEVQQLEIKHAIDACKKALSLAKMFRKLVLGDDNEEIDSSCCGTP